MRALIWSVAVLALFLAGCAADKGEENVKRKDAGSLNVECIDLFNSSGTSVCDGFSPTSAMAPMAVEEFRGEVSRSEEVFLYAIFDNTTGEDIETTIESGFDAACNGDPWVFIPEQPRIFQVGESDVGYGASCTSFPLGDHIMYLRIGGVDHTLIHFTTVE